MPARHRRSRILAFLVILFLVAPAGAGADSAPVAVAVVAPVVTSTFAELGQPPLTVTISRIIFTPGSGEGAEILSGPRLILVESGRLAFHASGDVPIVHPTSGPGTGPTATPTPAPTPTPMRSPTTDILLGPGDAAPVPIWTMHSLRDDGSEPAVILDVRLSSGEDAKLPADLDVEVLAQESGLTTLPTGRTSIVLGQTTIAAGGTMLAPPADVYQLVVPRSGDGRLNRAADGSIRNGGTTAMDAYVLSIATVGTAEPRQPAQPATGPGGAAVAFDRVVAAHYGADDAGYWLYEPADPHPGTSLATAGPFPVVLFLGGCCEVDTPPYYSSHPDEVQTWIDHLVQRGAIVVYPIVRGDHAEEDLVPAMREAMAELARSGHVPADWTRFAAIGFSFGGWYAPVYAADAAAAGLPVPQAVFSTVAFDPGENPDLSGISPQTRIVVLVGEGDVQWSDRGARRIWGALTVVPADHRSFVRLRNDLHGSPALFADHHAPATALYGGTLNTLDWYGTWKLGDALMSCAFAGQDCQYALGNTPEERFMGYWSDGVPVAELEVMADPGPPDPVTPTPAA
jgi:hypothetical protein